MEDNKNRAYDANAITRKYLDSILIEEHLIDSHKASTEVQIFSKSYKTPIMMPAFSHLNAFIKEQDNAMVAYAKAARELGALNWVGMSENEEFSEIMGANPATVRIIKPYADRDKIFKQIKHAEKLGAVAVGIDIDHAFGNDGDYDDVMGERMACITSDDIREFVQSTSLPFILKGILSAKDATKAAECGAKGIVVSHHHGRLHFAVPPLMVLPEIKQAVAGAEGFTVFVDCGIDTGADAFKALALGADAVAVGRALMQPLIKDGASGVEAYVTNMNKELATIMNYTGAASISEISSDSLWIDKSYIHQINR